jgi:hypothetical protein
LSEKPNLFGINELIMQEKKPKKKRGRPPKYGGFSLLAEKRREVRAYVSESRAGLIHDLGPGEENLTAAQLILVDRTTTALGIIRCIEEYIRENSVMRGSDLAPALQQSYLAYVNHVRLNLQALGIAARVKVGKDRHLKIMTIEKGAQGESIGDDPDTLIIEKVMLMPRSDGSLSPGQISGQDSANDALGSPTIGKVQEDGPMGESPAVPGENDIKRLRLEIAALEARKRELLARRGKDHGL